MLNILLHNHLAFLGTFGHIKSHKEKLYSWQSHESMKAQNGNV